VNPPGLKRRRVASTVTYALLVGASVVPVGACSSSPDAVAIGDDDDASTDASPDATASEASDTDVVTLIPPDASDAHADGSSTDGSMMEAGVDCDSGAGLICGGQCVDPSSPANCGSCTNVCPAVTHGTPTCSTSSDGGTSACGFSCGSGYHACTGQCLPDSDDPSTDACVVSETSGVFASPTGNDTTGAGTRAAPYQTLGHALVAAHAASKRVYACAGTYAENVVVGTALDGASVYGGLDCTGWAWAATNVVTVAPSSGYALGVDSLTTGATFEDMGFTAASATAAGGSSIAVFAKGSSHVVLRRSNVQAGLGMLGQDQTQLSPFSATAPIGNNGTLTGGGNLVSNSSCASSTGGGGGVPGPSGNDGSDGTPGTSNKGTVATCQMGLNGGPGAPGGPGSTGSGAATWAIFTSGGWAPTPGVTGGPGGVAEGGGGGASIDLTGGGGSGGAGGCGGAGGGAGTGGGSSIAVLVYASTIDFEGCSLSSANAGRGGNGAAGQTGQTGGQHGNAFGGACAGGKGGTGGSGGFGGGGAGGLSAGVVWSGTAPTIDGASTPSATTLSGVTTGSLGAGGSGAAAAQNGEAGVASAVVQFP
jgi:hypothetical protein